MAKVPTSRSAHKVVGLWGCILAVALWAFKPSLIALTPSSAGFAEVYLISGGIAVIAGLPFLLKWGLASRHAFSWRVISQIAVSGACLGMWYYGFYRALKEAPVMEASIIGFSWVLIAAIVMPYLGPKDIRKMSLVQWCLMVVAFLGVALVTKSGSTAGDGEFSELLWAGIAAVGSGLYLPFAVRATRALEKSVSALKATTLVITGANIASLIGVGTVLLVTNAHLNFTAVTPHTFLICAVIGVGIYVLAEVFWTWGYSQANSQAVGIMPYAVPAISSLLLVVLFGEQFTMLLLLGMGLIVAANILMQLVARKPIDTYHD